MTHFYLSINRRGTPDLWCFDLETGGGDGGDDDGDG